MAGKSLDFLERQLSSSNSSVKGNTSNKVATNYNPNGSLYSTGSVYSGTGNGAYSNVTKVATPTIKNVGTSNANTSSVFSGTGNGNYSNVTTKPTTTKTIFDYYSAANNNNNNNNNNNTVVDNTDTGNKVTPDGLLAAGETPTDSNNNDGKVPTSSNDYYTELINQLMSQNEDAREQALAAILQNLDAVKGTYKQQIQDVMDEYDALVNENEVKKERARRVLRENQANRGQLDSGMGRQELLDMNVGYDNETINLEAARTKAVNEIYNLIAQAEAEANTNKANVNNTYNNALLEYQMQLAANQ